MSTIYLTNPDFERLHQMVSMQRLKGIKVSFDQLGQELKRARKVEPAEILDNIVTMNSRVRLQNLKTKKKLEITLVYPEHANVEKRKISVLAPVGTAILGCKAGDVVEWPLSNNQNIQYVIEKVLYQPEAAGDFHL